MIFKSFSKRLHVKADLWMINKAIVTVKHIEIV